MLQITGEKHHRWKGSGVSYNGLHKWVNKYKGKAFGCEECGSQEKQRYEWANISQEYKRELDDFRSLCVSCHRKDLLGRRLSPRTEFKKGMTPWNKYLGSKICEVCKKTFRPKTSKNANKYCSLGCYWNNMKGKAPLFVFSKKLIYET